MIRKGVTARVIRPGDKPPAEEPWPGTPAERMEAVWTLTRACWAWTGEGDSEPRLQRSVVRVRRGGR